MQGVLNVSINTPYAMIIAYKGIEARASQSPCDAAKSLESSLSLCVCVCVCVCACVCVVDGSGTPYGDLS